MINVSNFILVSKILEIVCYELNCDFIDCEVSFSNKEDGWLYEDKKIIGPMDGVSGQTLARTIYSIIHIYIQHMPLINGVHPPQEKVKQILTYVFALVNAFTLKEGFQAYSDRSDKIPMKLSQHPTVWMLMKNIICPSRGARVRNIKILAAHSHVMDACVGVKNGTGLSSPKDDPFIFVNLDIESIGIRTAFLLYHAILFHFPDEDPSTIIKSIFTDHFMKNDLKGFLKMALEEDEEVASFFSILSLLTQMEEMEMLSYASFNGMLKVSQSNLQSWWFSGLIEKMLAPARGADWSVTEEWSAVTEDLWSRVESERKRRGMAEVPLEMLLRISSEHLKVDEKKTIQGLLGEARVW